jgi:hypothetical protein
MRLIASIFYFILFSPILLLYSILSGLLGAKYLDDLGPGRDT